VATVTKRTKRADGGPFDHRLVARTVFAVICAVFLGCCGFLLFGTSLSLQRQEATQHQVRQGTLLVVTDEGTTCRQMSFDNVTGEVVSVQKGLCRQVMAPPARLSSEDETPLGSIRKALSSNTPAERGLPKAVLPR
jgi:hypothetical protein